MNHQAMHHGMDTYSTDPGNGGAEAERVRLRFEREDAARMEYLDQAACKKPNANQYTRPQARRPSRAKAGRA